jgi:predicted ATPase/DNA-binding winged helix-turn-helix (wHTH) protein
VPGRFGFGDFEFDLVDKVLRKGQRAVRLSARQLALLAVLVQRHGEVVSKDELLSHVWPGQAVEENNVAVHVSGLRRLLGRAAIETVAGCGYRFAMPIHRAEAPRAKAPVRPEIRLRDLPSWPGSLLGRTHDLRVLANQVTEHRLVTVAGAPGIGKSTIALACAHDIKPRLRDGVVWAGLEGHDEPADVVSAVAVGLGLEAGTDRETVIEALRRLQVLLVIDNAEVDAEAVAAFTQAVLERADHVSMLVTSRRVLRVAGERVFRLPPLSVPRAGADLREAQLHGSVALFVDHAWAQDPAFELGPQNVAAVIEICRRLDGVPLAIQLAAGRLKFFGLQPLCERLGDRFRLLTRGMAGPRRHRSLRAAMDASYVLLNHVERQVFLALASFEGRFTLEQVMATPAGSRLQAWDVADALEGLVDQSLVLVEAGASPIYRLQESIRSYAQCLLAEAAEAGAAARRHAEAVRALFDRAQRVLSKRSDSKYLEQFVPELDKLRMALDWYLLNDVDAGVELMAFSRALSELLSLTYGPRAQHLAAALETPGPR